MGKKFYRSPLKAAELYVTLRQLTKSPYTNRGDDSGVLYCKAVYPLFEYSKDGTKTEQQIGWSYQCIVREFNNASIFVKVPDLACAVTQPELKINSEIPLQFNDFRGIWWVDNDGRLQISFKAASVERVPVEVY